MRAAGAFTAVPQFGTQQPADGFEKPAGEVIEIGGAAALSDRDTFLAWFLRRRGCWRCGRGRCVVGLSL